ncbi:Stage V sporulation protein K [Mixta intestinalis]|uniref:Stage V sporulation protein K n=1 Tax=Mixta intestinalis TaxID=1615494 RepID=A0A6P1Q5Q4_9GAMM|nr:Stage V sporulation protein K [Mixta intestinalis]
MTFKELLKFLFPEWQIFSIYRKHGLTAKAQPVQSDSPLRYQQTRASAQTAAAAQRTKKSGSVDRVKTASAWSRASKKIKNDELNRKFSAIGKDLTQHIVGQLQCQANLLRAFKRPFVAGRDRLMPANTLFLLGGESSGRHTLIVQIVKQLAERALIQEDRVNRLDLARYASAGDEQNFIQELGNSLRDRAEVIVFENFERCADSYLWPVAQLVTSGQYQYMPAGDATSLLTASGKYLVFISSVRESDVSERFGASFMQAVNDIIHVDDYTPDEIKQLTLRFLSGLEQRSQKNLHFTLYYDDAVVQYCTARYNKKQGLMAIQHYLHEVIYKALVEYRLQDNASSGGKLYFEVIDDALVLKPESPAANPVYLNTLLPNRQNDNLLAVQQELESVIGLQSVKEYVLGLENNARVQKRREKAGYKFSPVSMHMIFTGNPGTGKTMMARIVARYLKAIGVLTGGQLKEVTRADLVGKYVGHTARLTNEVIQSALGGVLFIDEAYALCRDRHDVFGIEAVDALVKGIEDHRDNLVVILAGYSDEMQTFLQANSGLKSRFPNLIHFDDYSADEMLKIAGITARSKGYVIDEACNESLIRQFEKSQIKGRNDSGNGRLVRNIIESAIVEQSRRLARDPKADMGLLMAEDFRFDRHQDFDLESALASIVGLENVKEAIRAQHTMLLADEKRRKADVVVDIRQSLNIIFTGNPGTGKTTIARVMAAMFKNMGLLKQGQLIETDRSGLVSEYYGKTAEKTEAMIKSALGGVLFIDEAYSLSANSPNDKEAIDTLVKLIEDYRGELVVILAGYKKEMADFMKNNSGLESRFPLVIHFPDYTVEELYKIALLQVTNKGFRLTGQAQARLHESVAAASRTASAHSGNGRMVRNMLENILRKQSARIATTEVAAAELTTILPEDIGEARPGGKTYDLEAVLNDIIGLSEVKTYIRSLYARLRVLSERRKMGLPVDASQTLHMIFKGNPGTGKTMMARIIADVLAHINVIQTNNLVETDRAGLVAGYVGQTAIKTTEKVREAMDGVLFIDEAYALAQGGANDFGREAIDTLVKLMDDNRDRLVVILAGYSQNMDEFLEMNPGLKSRFPNIIQFDDYRVDELMRIADQLYQKRGYVLEEAARQKMRALFTQAVSETAFGNGRYVRNVFEKSLNQQALRLSTDPDLTREELITIEASDISVR